MIRASRIVPIALVVFASFALARQGDVFIDSKWKIELTTADAGGKNSSDTLSFIHNTFSSQFFEKHGFKPCAYDEDVRRGNIGSFTAENKSDKEGTLKWTGTVSASNIQGDVTWTKPNGDEIHYSFTGEKLPK